jgi:hypothetical protein
MNDTKIFQSKTFKSYNNSNEFVYRYKFENDLSFCFKVEGSAYIDEFETLSGQFRFMVIDSFLKI